MSRLTIFLVAAVFLIVGALTMPAQPQVAAEMQTRFVPRLAGVSVNERYLRGFPNGNCIAVPNAYPTIQVDFFADYDASEEDTVWVRVHGVKRGADEDMVIYTRYGSGWRYFKGNFRRLGWWWVEVSIGTGDIASADFSRPSDHVYFMLQVREDEKGCGQ